MLSNRCPVCLSVYLPVCLSCLFVCDVGVLWPNGWTDQDRTWHAGKTRSWPHCVRWESSSPPQRGTASIFRPISVVTKWLPRKKVTAPTQFLPMSFCAWPNGWMDEDVTWYESRPRPRPHCVRRTPTSQLPPRKGHSSAPALRPMSIVATVTHLSYC